ncbi:MAG: hypothetical protein AAF657_15190 [Acidobacteriota bacterium]
MEDKVSSRRSIITWTLAFCAVTTGWPAGAEQPTSLRIKNECKYPIWIQQDFKHPTNDPIVVPIAKNKTYDYHIPEAGLASTRFWAKANCNQYGYDCAIGESVGVESARALGHQTVTAFDPDINSKFEATWGCKYTGAQASKCAVNPSSTTTPKAKLDDWTYWDGSAVDGYTFAYDISVSGTGIDCRDQHTGKALPDPNVVCSGLKASDCPTAENLSTNGQYNSINGVNVTSVNLELTAASDGSKVIGCFGPCAKLTTGQREGWRAKLGGLDPSSPQAKMYCCGGGVSSAACSAGVAAKTKYRTAVQKTDKCDAYTYAYDDAKGLAQCKASAKFLVTFCPGGNSLPLPPKRTDGNAVYCNPGTNPPQVCPGNVACPQCGSTSCECPAS